MERRVLQAMTMEIMYSYILIQGIGYSMAEYSRHFSFPIGDRLSYSRERDEIEKWILDGWINEYTVRVFQKTQEGWIRQSHD
jgi:hypothetical protein